MLDPEVVPVKDAVPFTELFGSLFDKYWRQFYETHKPEFEEFLRTNNLTDEKLANAGIDKEDLAKQFCAVQISYYTLRYSGLLNVRYVRVENRDEFNQGIEVVKGSPIKKKEITGERFGLLLSDILSGREYTVPGALDTFSTFGDCDETAFLIAQGIEAINMAHDLGMEVSLVPLENHTNIGVRFHGLNGVYRVDPTMLKGGIEGGKYPNKPLTKEDREEIAMNEVPEEKAYREQVIPRLNKKIPIATRDALIHKSEAERIESAVSVASTNSYLSLNLAFASMRILMNKGRRGNSKAIERFAGYLDKMDNASPEIIDVINRCVAAFGKDYEAGLAKLREAQQGLEPKQSLELLKVVAKEVAKGKEIYAVIKSKDKNKLAIAG